MFCFKRREIQIAVKHRNTKSNSLSESQWITISTRLKEQKYTKLTKHKIHQGNGTQYKIHHANRNTPGQWQLMEHKIHQASRSNKIYQGRNSIFYCRHHNMLLCLWIFINTFALTYSFFSYTIMKIIVFIQILFTQCD